MFWKIDNNGNTSKLSYTPTIYQGLFLKNLILKYLKLEDIYLETLLATKIFPHIRPTGIIFSFHFYPKAKVTVYINVHYC